MYTFDRVVVSHLLNPARDTKPRQFSVMVSTDTVGSQVLAQGSVEGSFSANDDPLGDSYTIMLDRPIAINPDQGEYLISVSDGPLPESGASRDRIPEEDPRNREAKSLYKRKG